MISERCLPPWLLLCLCLVLASCGGFRTGTGFDERIDPSIAEDVPDHGPEFSWPLEPLPSVVITTETGSARLLRDYIHVRPLDQAGFDQLLANYPFLHRISPIPVTNDHGDVLTMPAPERVFHGDGSLEQQMIDVLLEIDWDTLDAGRFAGVELPYQAEAEYRFDSPEALTLLRLLVWMDEHDSRKVASVGPVMLWLDPDDTEHMRATDPNADNWCACIDGSQAPAEWVYDATPIIQQQPGIDVLECGRDFFVSGYDLLTFRSATVSDSWEVLNREQKIKAWVIPEEDYPIRLPVQGAVAYISWSAGHQFEYYVPQHAHNGGLPGTIRPDESKVCEWHTEFVCSLDYDNAGVWEWKHDGSDDHVGVLFYETDEEKCLIGSFLCAGLADDFIDHIAPIARAQTLSPVTYGTQGVAITLQTVEACGLADAETCNGQDDDCNGAIDDAIADLGQACAPAGYDPNNPASPTLCEYGVLECNDGQSACTGAVFAVNEICNNDDDDCDGLVDDGVPGEGLACGSAIGACTTGALSCDGTDMICVGAVGPADFETCGDDIDNDCDGSTDEGCPCLIGESRGCGINEGVCTIGVQNCQIGQWGTCSGVGPSLETCDGDDNDCNGETDEGLLNACNECGPVPPEICDFMDNDCDGLIDDLNDVPFALQNSCGQCGPDPVEVCNAIDDDCDGSIDEGLADCGIDFVYSNFELNGAGTTDMIAVAKPVFGSLVPLVFVDEYATGNDDDFAYQVTWVETVNAFEFHLQTAQGNGASRIRGRVGILGLGQDVAVPQQQLASFGNVCPVNLGGLDIGLGAAKTIRGTRAYLPSTDDDYAFDVFIEPQQGTGVNMRGCGWYGNGGSTTRSWATMLEVPATVQIATFSRLVANGNVDLQHFSFPDVTRVFPLVAVTRYDTNTDDDASWRVNCTGTPQNYDCVVEVSGGNNNTFVRVDGLILGAP